MGRVHSLLFIAVCAVVHSRFQCDRTRATDWVAAPEPQPSLGACMVPRGRSYAGRRWVRNAPVRRALGNQTLTWFVLPRGECSRRKRMAVDPARARELALALPLASEAPHFDRIAFR